VKRADIVALAATFVIVLGTVAGGALAHDRPAHMQRVAAATGVLTLSNTRADAAVITAQGLLPGRSATGTITLGNTGEVGGTLGLARTWIDDQPGANGGRLSDVLTLVIEDITGGGAHEVFYGELGGLERVALDALPASARRTYRFTVAFPDSGPHGADNAYIGSSVRFDYEWRADPLPPTATATPTPTATPPAGKPKPAPVPAGKPIKGQSGSPTPVGPTTAPRITLRVPHQRVMHTAAVRLYARCDVACKVRFSGRVKTARRARRARVAVLLRKRLFRGERRSRIVPVTGERGMALKLTPRGRRVLRRELDRHGRVAVVIRARVKGAAGVRRVRKRIVLHTTLIRNGVRINFR
jgi:hypothetical protein